MFAPAPDVFTLPLTPADELAGVRRRIGELQAREAMLERAILAETPLGRQPGIGCDLMVEQRCDQVFDVARLPRHIRTNPRYFARRVTTLVHVVAHRRATTGDAHEPMLIEPAPHQNRK